MLGHEGEWIKKCTELKVIGKVDSGRPKKTWKDLSREGYGRSWCEKTGCDG